jgi:hypothetical protein
VLTRTSQPLAQPERVQDEEQREPDRVGQRHLLFRRGIVVDRHRQL